MTQIVQQNAERGKKEKKNEENERKNNNHEKADNKHETEQKTHRTVSIRRKNGDLITRATGRWATGRRRRVSRSDGTAIRKHERQTRFMRMAITLLTQRTPQHVEAMLTLALAIALTGVAAKAAHHKAAAACLLHTATWAVMGAALRTMAAAITQTGKVLHQTAHTVGNTTKLACIIARDTARAARIEARRTARTTQTRICAATEGMARRTAQTAALRGRHAKPSDLAEEVMATAASATWAKAKARGTNMMQGGATLR